jgi:hypothetical protein
MYYLKKVITFSLISIFSLAFSQDDFNDEPSTTITITGTVLDASSGKPIPGANVTIDGDDLGGASDEDGNFSIENVVVGSNITASVIGYDEQTLFAESSEPIIFNLEMIIIELKSLDVVSSKASFRETPVAFTDINKEDIELRNASRDITMIMNETPGVHATAGSGGAGDSRVTIRGFDQRNIAIMVNGVPVNDMENGWVYWSNWDGMADVASNIQIQRGLGATNLAVASVGGNINISTSAANSVKGYGFKQEVGSDNFLKSSIAYNTGRLDNGFAFSTSLQRKTGNGWVDGTWSDAYAYFFTANKSFGDHSIDVALLGAPQQHGQRDGDNIHADDYEYTQGGVTEQRGWGSYSDYKTEYGDEDYRQLNFGGSGSGWGYVSSENAENIKMGTDESLDGFSDMLFGGIQHTKKVGDQWIINNRTNYYHKPVYNLNHNWKIDDQMSLSSVIYGSNGRGGGTGPLNSRGDFLGPDGEVRYYKYINPSQDANGLYQWDDLIAWNHSDWDSDAANGVGDVDYASGEYRSKAIIRASVNHHDWYGAISNLKYKDVIPDLTITTGIDLRSYKGEHYREVVNLLGGDYYVDSSDDNDVANTDKVKRIGDKVAYHNIGYNSWMGGFLQAEYSKDKLAAFFSAAGSNTTYQREDFFNYTDASGDQKSEKASYPGSAVKIGANYNINENMNIFANVGALSVAPNFRSVYLNYNNTVNPEAANEKVSNLELGFGYVNSSLILFGQSLDVITNINLYSTNWQDKQIVRTQDDLIYNITGVGAVHKGLEIEGSISSGDLMLYGAASLGDWRWDNNVVADVASDYDRSDSAETYSIAIYSDGLPVGDAPQRQLMAGLKYNAPFGLIVNPVFKFNDKHYSSYDPEDMNTEITSDKDSYIWQIPAYSTIDLHLSYAFGDMLPVPVSLGFHLLNATDAKYFTSYVNGDGGFYGLGTRYNVSLNVSIK